MNRIEEDLHCEQEQKQTGHLKEAADVDAVTVMGPGPGHRGSQPQPGEGAQEEAAVPDLNEHQCRFHPLPCDHQDGEEEDAGDGHKP